MLAAVKMERNIFKLCVEVKLKVLADVGVEGKEGIRMTSRVSFLSNVKDCGATGREEIRISVLHFNLPYACKISKVEL